MSLGIQDRSGQHQHHSQGHRIDSDPRQSQSQQPRQQVEGSNPIPRHSDQQRPVHYPYTANTDDDNNNSLDWKYVAGGVLLMLVAVPVLISGVFYLRGILKSETEFTGFTLLALGGMLFAAGAAIIVACCCINSGTRVTPAQTPRSPQLGTVEMETLNHAMNLHMRSVQPVRPPPYAPKNPTPPPYRSPTPSVGNARGPSIDRQRGTNNASSGPQIIRVQSIGSSVSDSPPPPSPSPRARPSTRAVGTNASDSRQDHPRTTHRPSAPGVRVSSVARPPAENRFPSPSTRSRRPVSPAASSASLPSVFRANSTDAARACTPGPTAGRRLSPVNRLPYPSRANVPRRSTVDNRRHYSRY